MSSQQPLTLESIEYYDSSGRKVRDYLAAHAELPALATVDFLVHEPNAVGANVVVQWSSADAGMADPIVEAVMAGQVGYAGISFSMPGRVFTSADRPPK